MLVLIWSMLRKVFLICLWSCICTIIFNCYAFFQVCGIFRGTWLLFSKNLEQRYWDQHSPLNSRFALLHDLDTHILLLIRNADYPELLFPQVESFLRLAKMYSTLLERVVQVSDTRSCYTRVTYVVGACNCIEPESLHRCSVLMSGQKVTTMTSRRCGAQLRQFCSAVDSAFVYHGRKPCPVTATIRCNSWRRTTWALLLLGQHFWLLILDLVSGRHIRYVCMSLYSPKPRRNQNTVVVVEFCYARGKG